MSKPDNRSEQELHDASDFSVRLRSDLQAMPRIQAPAGFEGNLQRALRARLEPPVRKTGFFRPGFFILFRSWPAYAQGAIAATVVIGASIVISQFAPQQIAVDTAPSPAKNGSERQIAQNVLPETVPEDAHPAVPLPSRTPTTSSPTHRNGATSPEAPPPDAHPETMRHGFGAEKPAETPPVIEQSATRGVTDDAQSAPIVLPNAKVTPNKSAVTGKKSPYREPSIIKADSTKSTLKLRTLKKDTVRVKHVNPKFP